MSERESQPSSSVIRPVPIGEATEIRRAAESGGFAITEIGGRPIMDAIHVFRAELDAQRSRLTMLRQSPQLGTSPGARAVSAHARLVAVGDTQSMSAVLDQAWAVLDELEAAIGKAMAGYREVDGENRQTIGKAGRP